MPFFSFIKSKLAVILLVTLVGLLWEGWEIAYNNFKWVRKLLSKFGVKNVQISDPDTVLDIILDVLGAIVYVWLVE